MEKNKIILILTIIGLIISSLLTYFSFNPEESGVCQINSYWDCLKVSQSEYSQVFGLPISFLGIIGFIILIMFSSFKFNYQKYFLTVTSGLFLLFSLYLTFIEFFMIKSLCLFCLTIFLILLALFIIILWKKE